MGCGIVFAAAFSLPQAGAAEEPAAPAANHQTVLSDEQQQQLKQAGASDRAVELCGQGKLTDAKDLAEQALSIRQRILEPNDPLIAVSVNYLAFIDQERGEYLQALPFCNVL